MKLDSVQYWFGNYQLVSYLKETYTDMLIKFKELFLLLLFFYVSYSYTAFNSKSLNSILDKPLTNSFSL